MIAPIAPDTSLSGLVCPFNACAALGLPLMVSMMSRPFLFTKTWCCRRSRLSTTRYGIAGLSFCFLKCAGSFFAACCIAYSKSRILRSTSAGLSSSSMRSVPCRSPELIGCHSSATSLCHSHRSLTLTRSLGWFSAKFKNFCFTKVLRLPCIIALSAIASILANGSSALLLRPLAVLIGALNALCLSVKYAYASSLVLSSKPRRGI